MSVAVTKVSAVIYQHSGRTCFVEVTSGKHSLCCVFNADGRVQVVVTSNASHRAWRGMGKTFTSFGAAMLNYKTDAIKAGLAAAAAANGSAGPGEPYKAQAVAS